MSEEKDRQEGTGGGSDGRITTEARGRLLLIGIERPGKLNSFTPAMFGELVAALAELEADGRTRCGVLFAHGEHFTAGIDLPKFAPLMAKGEALIPEGAIDPFGLRDPVRGKPLVCAVQGWCLTLGIELMLAADVVVAAEGTRFAQLEVKRGIMAAAGATIRMVERAGWGNAMRYLLTGDEFGPEEALRLGFVQEVVPLGAQLERAIEIATAIAQQAPLAVRATRASALKAVFEGPVAAIAELDATQKRLAASEDAAEGVRSFLERREAEFKEQ